MKSSKNISNKGGLETGITCQSAGGVLLKKLKYFEVMLEIFEYSRCEKLQNLDWPK